MRIILGIFCALFLTVAAFAQIPAFPGAQGSGADSVGGSGRNGTGTPQVFYVTNLQDSGTGSLRNCLQASGPRTCIFRVAGCITQKTNIEVDNPYLTVAGQTAPGELMLGCPGNSGFTLRISTHDTIVRYITISPDDPTTSPGPSTGTVGYSIVNTTPFANIADHLTLRWAGNKAYNQTANFNNEFTGNSTLQWSLLYEPHEGHPVGPSTSEEDNAARAALSVNFDVHHSMFVDLSHRIPEYNNKTMRWINNITFNWCGYAVQGLGATQSDIVGNVWAYSNLVPGTCLSGPHPIHSSNGNWPGSIPGTPSFYIAQNIGPGHTTPNADQYGDLAQQVDGEPGNEQGAFPSSWHRSSPLPSPNAFPIQVTDPTQLATLLTGTIGNSQHLDLHGAWVSHRDPQDTRIINQYNANGSGGFWPNGVTYNGVFYCPPGPVVSGCIPMPAIMANWTDTPVTGFPVCTTSLNDGICDQWKTDNSLSTTDPTLWKRIAPNGYTYLENFINGPGSGGGTTQPPPSGRPLPPTSPIATPH